MSNKIQIQPSLLAADHGDFRGGARRAEDGGGDALHADIMDGYFVPNLSMGPEVVRVARDAVSIPLSVHLMVREPALFIEPFAKAGSGLLLIHIEAEGNIPGLLKKIRDLGIKSGITANPGTPAEDLYEVIDQGLVDEALCMTVNPGFGGQAFITDVLPKVAEIRERYPDLDISVDGGLDQSTVTPACEHGANVIIAGTSLYREPDMKKAITKMRNAAEDALGSSGS